MKRDTRLWLKRQRAEDMDRSDHPVTDVLNSDARQRARIRELSAALEHFNFPDYPFNQLTEGEQAATKALAKRRVRR